MHICALKNIYIYSRYHLPPFFHFQTRTAFCNDTFDSGSESDFEIELAEVEEGKKTTTIYVSFFLEKK